MSSLKGKVAIVGLGVTEQGKLPGSTPISLGAEAFKRAIADAGLHKNQIDGLLTMPGTTSPEGPLNYLRLGETLGIDPRYTGSLVMGGGTAGALVQNAALAVEAGLANYVACVFGDTARTGGSKFSRAAGWGIPGGYGVCSVRRPTARLLQAVTWLSTGRPAGSSARSRWRAAIMHPSIPTP